MRISIDAPLNAEWMRGRAALVTGGGGRDGGPGTVGWAVSRLLARHGAAVAVLDRDPVAAQRTVDQIMRAGGRATPVIADVSDDQQCERAVTKARAALGGLDTLVNNVAAWSPAELFDVERAPADTFTPYFTGRKDIPIIVAGARNAAISMVFRVFGEWSNTSVEIEAAPVAAVKGG